MDVENWLLPGDWMLVIGDLLYMLVHIKRILNKAVKGKYAVGAFNVNNLETVLAVLNAAHELRSPIIIQMTEGAIKYAGLKELSAIVKAAGSEVNVPVAMHLDHGHDFEVVKRCIKAGFSSVMIDGSLYPYKKNVAVTRQVVNYAHRHGVFVQGELGQLEGLEDWVKVSKGKAYLTDPKEAAQFVKETGIDTFAVAIGNYHGVEKIIQKKVLRLDLKRLAEIAKLAPMPLVLHGASGFKEREIKGAIQRGIRVINIDSDLRVSFTKAERSFLEGNKNVFDPRKILEPAILAMQAVVEKKIRIFGSAHKA